MSNQARSVLLTLAVSSLTTAASAQAADPLALSARLQTLLTGSESASRFPALLERTDAPDTGANDGTRLGEPASATGSDLAALRRRAAAFAQEDEHRRAADGPRFYVELIGGFNFLLDGDLDVTQRDGQSTQGDANYDGGAAAGLAVGVELDRNWSAEVEYVYRRNDIDSWTDRNGGGALTTGGDFASVAIMLNAYYTFLPEERIRPYIGAGIGLVQEIDIDIEPEPMGGEDSALGYQAMAGVLWEATDSLVFSVEGRFMSARGFDLERGGSDPVYSGDYDNLGVMLGARWRF